MIVLNPPAEPGHLELITRTPEHRAVETAIRIARVPFQCAELTKPSAWDEARRFHGEDVTFVLDLAVPISIAVFSAGQPNAITADPPMIVDGAQGVLELAALIAGTAGPDQPRPTPPLMPGIEAPAVRSAFAATTAC